jgi:hypothetical protein
MTTPIVNAPLLLVVCIILAACGQSAAECTAQVTAIAAGVYATPPAAVPAPTSTPFPPTPAPIPVTPTLPPDARILELVSEGGKVGLADGTPNMIWNVVK